jgi:N-acetylglucosamine-6-phosphate deacetylase
VTAEQAIRMGSEIPARSAHIDGVCGLILPGRNADLNIYAPDMALEATYIGGTLVEPAE